jgi:hypothetical protein
MVLEKKNIDLIKKSIEDYNNYSKKEKDTLVDSIEMFWLNAGIQKKKRRRFASQFQKRTNRKNSTAASCSLV